MNYKVKEIVTVVDTSVMCSKKIENVRRLDIRNYLAYPFDKPLVGFWLGNIGRSWRRRFTGQWIMSKWRGLTVGQLRCTSDRGGCQGLGFELHLLLLLLLVSSGMGMGLLDRRDRRSGPLWRGACMPLCWSLVS